MNPSDAPAGEEAWRDRFLRLSADLDNIRRRSQRELEESRLRERAIVLRGFLAILDNFDRALATPGSESNPWLDGFTATREQMLATLLEYGARPFDVVGLPFDPKLHEAVATVSDGDRPDGTVIEVVQTGFMIGETELLRPARVVVVRNASYSEQ